jgi:hypothetical protein
MSLMRWTSNTLQPIGGWTRLTEAPLDSPVRKFFTWRDNTNQVGTLAGTDNKLYIDYAGSYQDITPVGFLAPIPTTAGGYGTGPYGAGTYGTPRPVSSGTPVNPMRALWSFDNFGEDVFFTASSDGRLFRYIRATGNAPPVAQTGAPIGNTGVVTTEERHVMVLGTTSNAGPDIGTFYPRRIAWCSQENPSDWDFANLTNTAGFLDLDAARSPLLRGVRVLGGTLVFSATEVFLVRYQGLPYVYGAERVGTVERLHASTVATWNGQAMWWTSKGFQIFMGGYVQAVPCPIFADLIKDMDPIWGPARAHSAHNGAFPELWFFYPSRGQRECNRYAIYNYIDATWGWGRLARSAMAPAGPTSRPLMGGRDMHIYDHENGWTDAGTPILDRRYIESGALGVGGGEQLTEVRQAMLATDKPGCVDMTFYGRMTPDGEERTFGPYVPRSNGYTDTRVNAREARVRYTGRIDDAYSVGLLRLEVSAGGTR